MLAEQTRIRARRSVEAVEEYSAPLEGRRGMLRLDFNEMTTPLGGMLPGMDPEQLAAYPEYEPLLAALSREWGLPREMLLPVNGSGEGIMLCAFCFIEPGEDSAVVSRPSFALIPHYLKLAGARLLELDVDSGLGHDCAAIEAALRGSVKLLMLASPDNPTGAVLDSRRIEAWCREFPQTLFVIDEAYHGFSTESVLPLTREFGNLLVLRSFSKAMGLAGLRLGVVCGCAPLLVQLRKLRAPYSVNQAAVEAALSALGRQEELRDLARRTMRLQEVQLQALAAAGWSVQGTAANFHLLDAGWEAGELCGFLRDAGVLVRDRSSYPGMAGKVRITAGSAAQNMRVRELLEEFRRSRAIILDLDDTLVDTSRSFDAAVLQLCAEQGVEIERAELLRLRAEGGFNDDWEAAAELLARRGIQLALAQLQEQGQRIYLATAKVSESLLYREETLRRLAGRHPLYVLTGRRRAEYEPVWDGRLDQGIRRVCCRDDFPGLRPKPSGEMLRALMEQEGLLGGCYVGNSPDDMRAACDAGLMAIGLATTLPAEVLRESGAAIVLAGINELPEVFGL